MSQSTHALIGRIINPGPRPENPPQAAPPPAQSLEVLIGRIIHPYGPPGLRAEIVAPQEPITALVAEPLPPA